ncbi:hypothetical protein GGR51DRAFT_539069 [Nemania sp. FL0031]|nr:hypothetical protein GGR51DRAFT_539069 [Nemania sp. FL0031]
MNELYVGYILSICMCQDSGVFVDYIVPIIQIQIYFSLWIESIEMNEYSCLHLNAICIIGMWVAVFER